MHPSSATRPTVTKTSLVYQDAHAIVHLLMIPGGRTSVEVEETISALNALVQDTPFLLLVEVLPLTTFQQAAFDAMYHAPVMRYAQAVAFVGNPLHTCMIRQQINRLSPLFGPAQLFETQLEARDWLLGRKWCAQGAVEQSRP